MRGSRAQGADRDDYLGIMTEAQGELPVDLIEPSGGSVGRFEAADVDSGGGGILNWNGEREFAVRMLSDFGVWLAGHGVTGGAGIGGATFVIRNFRL